MDGELGLDKCYIECATVNSDYLRRFFNSLANIQKAFILFVIRLDDQVDTKRLLTTLVH